MPVHAKMTGPGSSEPKCRHADLCLDLRAWTLLLCSTTTYFANTAISIDLTMAQQQLQFAETIRSMKLAMKRRASDSDSDDLRHHTNRGNKLNRRAKHVRQDRLDDTGRLAYRTVWDDMLSAM